MPFFLLLVLLHSQEKLFSLENDVIKKHSSLLMLFRLKLLKCFIVFGLLLKFSMSLKFSDDVSLLSYCKTSYDVILINNNLISPWES